MTCYAAGAVATLGRFTCRDSFHQFVADPEHAMGFPLLKQIISNKGAHDCTEESRRGGLQLFNDDESSRFVCDGARAG
jgi:hypothetical protein